MQTRKQSFIVLLSVLLIAGVRPAASASDNNPVKVGILVQEMERAQSQAIKGLGEELKRAGYQLRKDLVLETRNAKGNRASLQPAAAELVAQKVKLIFTTGTSATRAAIGATREIPVVFVHPGDPAVSGLLKSGRDAPKNVTGVAAYAAQTTEQRLAFLKEMMPDLRKIWVFFDTNNSVSRDNFKFAEAAAAKVGVQCIGYGVKAADELKTTLAELRAEDGAAIFQVADEVVENEAEFLFETARAKKIPTMFNEESWAIAGALGAYGPNYLQMGRQAGQLADKIIKGESPAALPVVRASKFEITLNYRTARFIGFELTPEIIKKANRVIR